MLGTGLNTYRGPVFGHRTMEQTLPFLTALGI